MPDAKPYVIPKRLVWDAYQRVKANQGAAGVDGETVAAFESDLKNNLYKVWNRMASGSYFPPPVRLVEIPKDNGGSRPLGIPTVADRVAQTVVILVLEPAVDSHFHPDSYGYRPGFPIGRLYKAPVAWGHLESSDNSPAHSPFRNRRFTSADSRDT
jgi:RNA-directed DNA polymerase